VRSNAFIAEAPRGDNPSGHPPMLVSRLDTADADAVRAIAQASAATVDVDAELARRWALIWVARPGADGAPVAFLLAWAVADELHLIHIATHPETRRRGAGRALMAALVAHAADSRSRLLLLEVRRSNRPAIRLYRAFGFTAMGVRRGYYADGEDAIEMSLTLDPTTGHVTPGHDEVVLAEA
jgi:ribosomal-protein-alanine N-acetyltransferase